jgi:hypothetical protein
MATTPKTKATPKPKAAPLPTLEDLNKGQVLIRDGKAQYRLVATNKVGIYALQAA